MSAIIDFIEDLKSFRSSKWVKYKKKFVKDKGITVLFDIRIDGRAFRVKINEHESETDKEYFFKSLDKAARFYIGITK